MSYNFFAKCGTGVSSFVFGSTTISGTSWQSISSAYQYHTISSVEAKSGYDTPYKLYLSEENPESSSSTVYFEEEFETSVSVPGNTNDYARFVEVRATALQTAELTVKRDTNKYISKLKFTNGKYATFDGDDSFDYVEYSSSIQISSVTFTSAASTFSGTLYWQNSYGTQYKFATVDNGAVTMVSSSNQETIDYTGSARTITLVADGSLTKTYKYRVKYWPNGGSFVSGADYIYQPQNGWYQTTSPDMVTVTLSPYPKPTRVGYTLKGWAISSTSSVTTSTVTMTPLEGGSTYPVYAVWEEEKPTYKYRIAYSANGGAFSNGEYVLYDPSSSNYYTSETESVTVRLDLDEEPTRTNYEFVGWAITQTSTTTTTSITMTATSQGANFWVYAVWKPIYKYRIAYSANGGAYSDGVDVKYTPSANGYYKTYNQTVTVNLSTPDTLTKPGYDFVGWSTTTTGTTPISSITVNATLGGTVWYVYAIWQVSGKAPNLTSVTISYSNTTAKLKCTWTSSATVGTTYAYAINSNGEVVASSSAVSSSNTSYTATLNVTAGGTYTIYARHKNGDAYADSSGKSVTTKPFLSSFYWHGSDESDNEKFQENFTLTAALTASGWNAFLSKIQVAQAYTNIQKFTFTSVATGNTLQATSGAKNNGYNEARSQIIKLTSYGSIPVAKTAGDIITPDLFNGSGSLKSALNTAIKYYNDNR